jgi:DNA repair protein RecO (recombination protein O)
MRVSKTEAIVLQTFQVRDRDKLVVFLTPDHGKRKGWAYGARTLKSRFGAALEPLAKIRIGFIEREGDEVVRIESVDLIRSLFAAQQQLQSSIAATYIAETVDTFAQPEDPLEVLYRLLDRSTEALLEGAPPLPLIAYVEVWVLKLAGIFPSTRACSYCQGPLTLPLRYDATVSAFACDACAPRNALMLPNDVSETLFDILRSPIAEFANREQRTADLFEVRAFAADLRRSFLGHELKSYEILQSVIGKD